MMTFPRKQYSQGCPWGLLIMDARVEPAHDGGEIAIPTQRKLL